MLATDLATSDALSNQLLGLAEVVTVSSGFGWMAQRIFDPGVRARGISMLAGLTGLYAGGWAARLAAVDAGPSVLGYGLVPSFLGAVMVCVALRLVSLGVAGSRG